jgi:spore protease
MAEGAEKQTELPGVEARDKVTEGFRVTTVKILNEEGERELGKPVGTYVTIELDDFVNREDAAFSRGAAAVSREISDLLKINKDQRVLVVGLGNGAITPDAIGPKTARHTMVTWHLVEKIPEHFGAMRRVSVLESGVLGTTGIESTDVIRAIKEQIHPDCVIVIDALASRKLSRVCRTIQLADTGIVPGSGVYNDRMAINAETLGVRFWRWACRRSLRPARWPPICWNRRAGGNKPLRLSGFRRIDDRHAEGDRRVRQRCVETAGLWDQSGTTPRDDD